MPSVWVWTGAALAAGYVVLVWRLYSAIRQGPLALTRLLGRLPGWALPLTPFPLLWHFARRRPFRRGSAAPELSLERADGGGVVSLSEHRGLRPVVLIFGSYT